MSWLRQKRVAIRFERTRDVARIRSIVTHPEVFPHMVSDGGGTAESYRPCMHEQIWHMLAMDGNELLGLFMAVWLSPVLLEIHVCLLPNCRGGRAIQAYRDGLTWIWQKTSAMKVIGNTPADNRAALLVARRAGLTINGVNDASLMRDGKMIDQIILGIKRPQ